MDYESSSSSNDPFNELPELDREHRIRCNKQLAQSERWEAKSIENSNRALHALIEHEKFKKEYALLMDMKEKEKQPKKKKNRKNPRQRAVMKRKLSERRRKKKQKTG